MRSSMSLVCLALALAACDEKTDPTDEGTDDTEVAGETDPGPTDTSTTEETDAPADSDPVDQGGPDADAPADPDVQTWLPPELAPVAPVRLVFLGDSITAGAGATREALDYVQLLQDNDHGRWPGYDDLDLASTHPTITEVIDVSQGGAVTDNVLRQQIPNLKKQLGDTLPVAGETIIVFTIGGNDAQSALIPGANAARIVDKALANMETIIQRLQDPTLFETPPAIYATNIYEPTDGVGRAQECFLNLNFGAKLPELERYDTELLALAETYGFAAVDLHHHFQGHGYHHDDATNPHHEADDPSLWFYDDCIHPNDRGHHELRRLFWYAIQGEPLPLDLP